MYCVRRHLHSRKLTHDRLLTLTYAHPLVEGMPKGGLEDGSQENLPIPRSQQNRYGPRADGEPTSREAVITVAEYLAWVARGVRYEGA